MKVNIGHQDIRQDKVIFFFVLGKQAMASSHSHNRRFNLGSLLAGSRSSDFVGKDDEQRLELKHLQSDSEVEEFSSVTQQNA